MLRTAGRFGAPGVACRDRRLGCAAPRWRCGTAFGHQGGLLYLLLFGGKGRRDVSTPLIFQIDGILLVDLLLLFRRRIGACDIEASILHEIEIAIATARLAAACEFGVALGKRGSFRFLACGLLGDVGAFLEIGRSARPPLRARPRGRKHGAADHRGHQEDLVA